MNRRELMKTGSLSIAGLSLPFAVKDISGSEIIAREKLDSRKQLVDIVLNTAERLGAEYCDVRIGSYYSQRLIFSGLHQDLFKNQLSMGMGIRVLFNGAWGFVATNDLRVDSIRQATQQAVVRAKTSGRYQKQRFFRQKSAGVGEQYWRTPIKVDPFQVPLSEKVALLKQAASTATSGGARHIITGLFLYNDQKYFASTDGSYIDQDLYRVWAPFEVFAQPKNTRSLVRRSDLGAPMGMGYEYLMPRAQDFRSGVVNRYDRSYDLVRDVADATRQVKEKAIASTVKAGQYDVIIDPGLLHNIIHKTVGEPMFMLQQSTRFHFDRQGPNFIADRSQPGGLASVKFDDEGMKTRVVPLFEKGAIKSSSVQRLDSNMEQGASGFSFANSWQTVQKQSLPNISMLPNKEQYSLEKLIAGVSKGLYMLGTNHLSVDATGNNFHVAPELCYKIEKGRITRQVNHANLVSDSRTFWRKYRVNCDDNDYRLCGRLGAFDSGAMGGFCASYGCSSAVFDGVMVSTD